MDINWYNVGNVVKAQVSGGRDYFITETDESSPRKGEIIVVIIKPGDLALFGFFPTVDEAKQAVSDAEDKIYEAELLASLEKGE